MGRSARALAIYRLRSIIRRFCAAARARLPAPRGHQAARRASSALCAPRCNRIYTIARARSSFFSRAARKKKQSRVKLTRASRSLSVRWLGSSRRGSTVAGIRGARRKTEILASISVEEERARSCAREQLAAWIHCRAPLLCSSSCARALRQSEAWNLLYSCHAFVTAILSFVRGFVFGLGFKIGSGDSSDV